MFLFGRLSTVFLFFIIAGQYSFLVRPSETSPGNYTLYFYVDNTIHRYRIVQIDKYFHIGGRTFDSISSIIERYKREDLMEGNRRLVEWNYTKYQNYDLKGQLSDHNSNEDDEDEDIGIDDIDDVEVLELNGLDDDEEEEEIDLVENTNFNNENNTPHDGLIEDQKENYITIDVQSSIIASNLVISSKQQQYDDDESFSLNRKRNSIGPDIFTRKTDQVTIKGNLNKYSMWLSFVSSRLLEIL